MLLLFKLPSGFKFITIMPIPAALALGAGAQLLGGALNSGAQAQANRDNRDFSWNMYKQQRADAIEFWHMQNDYNSPQEQMKRFQAAGLNPHLIYGQGNPGNAGAIPVPDVQPAQARSPEWGNGISSAGLAYMNSIYDLDIKAAQLDNLKAQNTVIRNEGILKEVVGKRSQFALDFDTELRDVSAEARREQLRQLKVQTDVSINRDAREAALNASNLKEAAERMLNLREQRLTMEVGRAQARAEIDRIRESIQQMEKDGVLKDLDIELRRQGINPNDPMWARIVGRVLSNVFEHDGSFKIETGNIWKKLFGW